MSGDNVNDFGHKLYTSTEAWELSLLALLVWREAQNQPRQGKFAVAWSVRNRVLKPGKTWWGDDWESVVLHPWQYSSFNANDPNAVKLPGNPNNDAVWKECIDVAEQAYLGLGPDPSLGATHYYAKSIAPPPWVATATFTVEIQDHRFYIAS